MQSVLSHCCSHAAKSGFLTTRGPSPETVNKVNEKPYVAPSNIQL